MTIKCPVCDDEERHQYDDEPIKEHDEAYHKLLEKIHEKIEFYEKELCQSEDFTVRNIASQTVLEMKSLLENK
jgi:hypothetical protein